MKRSQRTARFLVVGWIGFGVQSLTLAFLTALAHWPWLPATCVAVEMSIVHNYVWHARWTWNDRGGATTMASWLARFARYNVATGIVSIAGNVALTAFYLRLLPVPAVAANTLAVGTLTLLNFVVADRCVWGAAAALLIAVPSAASAQPAPETIQAWDRYVAQLEARIERDRAANVPPSMDVTGDTVSIPSGAIHSWRGGVFVPGVTVDRMLADLLSPGGSGIRQEDVAESRTLSRTGDTVRTYLRLVRGAIVTVTYDTEHEMTFHRWSPALATARSVATSIREVGGADRGFLWRLNSYWRYRQVEGGVIVELESVTLSRSIPAAIRPIAMPIIRHIARESMARTLAAVRERYSRSSFVSTIGGCAF